MLTRRAYAAASAVGRVPLALSRAFSPAARGPCGSAPMPLALQQLSLNGCGPRGTSAPCRAHSDTSCFAHRLHEHVRSAAAAASLLSGHELHQASTTRMAGLTVRSFSSSALMHTGDGASVGDGVVVNMSVPAPPAPAGDSIKTRVFWVQRTGAKDPAKLTTGAADVGDLKEEIKKKLPSLRDLDADSITLQLASADGTLFTHAKDAAGNEQPVTLSSMDTIDEALKKAAEAAGRTIGDKDKLRIIVAVAAPAAQKLQEYAPDHRMSKLARGLLEAEEVDVPAGAGDTTGTRTVTLPHGVFWPDLDSTVLFVRHFYENLWGKVLNTCKPQDDLRDAVIMGTPGIAKSAFGLYALYRAVKAGRTVIYSARKGGKAVLKGGKAYTFRADELDSLVEMDDPEALYICDSLPPVARVAAFRLLITSPKKETWSTFVQSPHVRQFVLPSFTLPEMLQLSKVGFSHEPCCSEDEVKERFRRWGGSARSVLTHGSDAANQRRLETAAGSLPLASVEEAMTGMRALDGVGGSDYVHRLLDILPLGALPTNTLTTNDPLYYEFHHAQLITEHVVVLFSDALLKRDKMEMFRFLHRAASDPAASTLRGKLYERCVAVPRFVHGSSEGQDGDLQLVRLTPKLTSAQPAWLKVPKLSFKRGLQLVHFRDLADLARKWKEVSSSTCDAIFVPYSKAFPVVDFALRVGGEALLANATVGESHGVKLAARAFRDALLPAVGLADTNKEIPLAWILDKPAFERFDDAGQVTSQSGGDLVVGATARHPIGRRLVQYKVLLEVPPVMA